MSQAVPMPGAMWAVLPDGRRQHFQHGPIDLVIEAFGETAEVQAAYHEAWRRFETVLGDLVSELPALRTDVQQVSAVSGSTARRMVAACHPYSGTFVTPMASVAGAVADEVLAAMTDAVDLQKAYVNNGGDIAIHLAPGEHFTTGVVSLADTPTAEGVAAISATDDIGGIATSGWRGRSLSLGIADSVTVLAASAAAADVAATLIANATTVESAAVTREPATALDADSDLGDRLVTVAVDRLSEQDVTTALDNGVACASGLCQQGLITAAILSLKQQSRACGRQPSVLRKAEVEFTQPTIARAQAA